MLASGDPPIPEVPDPWDAIDVLEAHDSAPDFDTRWRGFLRDCALLLLPRLPPAAAGWVATADEFDAGRLSAESLTGARVEAWRFHNAQQAIRSAAELSGLRVVMYRLWPPGADRWWRESAWHFLHFLRTAGCAEEQWWLLLRARFAGVLGGPPDAESGAEADRRT